VHDATEEQEQQRPPDGDGERPEVQMCFGHASLSFAIPYYPA
jgi:hypothetical protein